jgi:hypothetical protein
VVESTIQAKSKYVIKKMLKLSDAAISLLFLTHTQDQLVSKDLTNKFIFPSFLASTIIFENVFANENLTIFFDGTSIIFVIE